MCLEQEDWGLSQASSRARHFPPPVPHTLASGFLHRAQLSWDAPSPVGHAADRPPLSPTGTLWASPPPCLLPLPVLSHPQQREGPRPIFLSLLMTTRVQELQEVVAAPAPLPCLD